MGNDKIKMQKDSTACQVIGTTRKGDLFMKRIKAARVQQAIHFQRKDGLERAGAVRAVEG